MFRDAREQLRERRIGAQRIEQGILAKPWVTGEAGLRRLLQPLHRGSALAQLRPRRAKRVCDVMIHIGSTLYAARPLARSRPVARGRLNGGQRRLRSHIGLAALAVRSKHLASGRNLAEVVPRQRQILSDGRRIIACQQLDRAVPRFGELAA